jgi:hypothetical protein
LVNSCIILGRLIEVTIYPNVYTPLAAVSRARSLPLLTTAPHDANSDVSSKEGAVIVSTLTNVLLIQPQTRTDVINCTQFLKENI